MSNLMPTFVGADVDIGDIDTAGTRGCTAPPAGTTVDNITHHTMQQPMPKPATTVSSPVNGDGRLPKPCLPASECASSTFSP